MMTLKTVYRIKTVERKIFSLWKVKRYFYMGIFMRIPILIPIFIVVSGVFSLVNIAFR